MGRGRRSAPVSDINHVWSNYIGLTNRPLTKSEAILPEDERLELHRNVDPSTGVSAVEARLKRIDGIEGVTHVYFSCK